MLDTALARLRWTKRFLMHSPLKGGDKKELLAQAGSPSQDPYRWSDGAHISQARNAHYTNTKGEMAKGLSGDYNFLEGDVWLEAAARSLPVVDLLREPIMAHYPDDVKGLTLKEWLQVGKRAGKGLKLDIKQSAAIPKVIKAVKETGIPEERLIFNADMAFGPGLPRTLKFRAIDAATDLTTQTSEMREIREAFPKSTIGVGLYTGKQPAGVVYSRAQLESVIKIAQDLGGPITFPLRAEFVTAEAVAALKPYGSVSVWNDPKTYLPDDLKEAERFFRSLGVDGMVDLRDASRPLPEARQLPPETDLG